MLHIIYGIWHFSSSLEGWHTIHTCNCFHIFLYLPMNCIFVTKGIEFSQFQSTRCIVSILLSNISGNTNPLWFLISIISNNTIGTFQNNCYSNIFPLGHELPLYFWFTQLFSFAIQREKRIQKKKKKLLTRNKIMKNFVAIKIVIISNTWFLTTFLIPI